MQGPNGVEAGSCQLESALLGQGNAEREETALHWCELFILKMVWVQYLILHPFQTCGAGRAVTVFRAIYEQGDRAWQVCSLSRVNLLKIVGEWCSLSTRFLKCGTPASESPGSTFKMTTPEILNQRTSGVRVQKSAFLL